MLKIEGKSHNACTLKGAIEFLGVQGLDLPEKPSLNNSYVSKTHLEVREEDRADDQRPKEVHQSWGLLQGIFFGCRILGFSTAPDSGPFKGARMRTLESLFGRRISGRVEGVFSFWV